MFRNEPIPEEQIYELLANRRRRETVQYLTASSSTCVTIRELSEVIATRETGTVPPPQEVRESVYNSLHQTHLPKLDELGVVTYDRAEREIRLHGHARNVDQYMGVRTRYGVTWTEIYRTLGVVSLTVVVTALAEVPLVGSIDPLLWSIGFLLVFIFVISCQLWSNRWYLMQVWRNNF